MNRARSAQRKCNRRGARCCKALSLCRSTSISACSRQSRFEAVIQQADEKEDDCNHSAIMFRFAADRETNGLNFRKRQGDIYAANAHRDQKLEIIEHEWAKARAKNPEVIIRVHVQDETDESGKPRVNVVIAFSGTWASIKKCPRKNSSNSKAL